MLGRNLIAIQQPRAPGYLAGQELTSVPLIAMRCSGTIHRRASMSAVLEMAVLGLLKEQDMHGYELKKRLSDVFGLSSAVSFGSLYPALARLEAAGAVLVVTSPGGQAAPSAGGNLGRSGVRAGVGRFTPSRLLGPQRSKSC